MTQKERVLSVLKNNYWVMDRDIILKAHVYQYNSVIHSLRKDGWDIRSIVKKVPNPANPCVTVKSYGYTLYKEGVPYGKYIASLSEDSRRAELQNV